MVRTRVRVRRRRIRKKPRKQLVRYSNPLGARIRNTARKFRCNFTFFVPVTTNNVAGFQFRQLVIPFNFPGMVRNYQATRTLWVNMTSAEQPANFTPHMFGTTAMFDQYKVQKITVRMYPAEQQVMQVTEDWPTADYSTIMYTMFDPDSDALMLNEQGYLNAGVSPFNLGPGRNVKRVFKQTRENRNKWLNTAAYNADPNDAATPISQTGINHPSASIKLGWYLHNGTQTVAGHIGRLYVTYDVMFRALSGD